MIMSKGLEVRKSLTINEPRYLSRPDIESADFDIVYHNQTAELAPGYYFIAEKPLNKGDSPRPSNIALFDNKGELVYWHRPEEVAGGKFVYNWRVQEYQRQAVLTYTTAKKKLGSGYYVDGRTNILSSNYSVIASVTLSRAGDAGSDAHESKIVDGKNLIVTALDIVENYNVDYIEAGQGNRTLADTCFYELSLPAGNPLKHFCPLNSSIDAIDSYVLPSSQAVGHPWDFFHMNSIDKDALGNYLVSARFMSAIYYVSGEDFSIIWTLGGKKSDFHGSGLDFHFQHDAKWVYESHYNADQLRGLEKRRIALFDTVNAPHQRKFENQLKPSYGRLIELDLESRVVTLLKTYGFPNGTTKAKTSHQGSIQLLSQDHPASPSDNVLVGFGSSPVFIEYDSDANPLLMVHYGHGAMQSYRIYKYQWTGIPLSAPDVAVQNHKIYMSWNGATEPTHWRVEQAGAGSRWSVTAAKTGFETVVNVQGVSSAEPFQAVALDRWGNELARSQFVAINGTLLGGQVGGSGIQYDSLVQVGGVQANSLNWTKSINKVNVAAAAGVFLLVAVAVAFVSQWLRLRRRNALAKGEYEPVSSKEDLS